MFHARIVSPRGSLYFAAEPTPYDLESLRTHVLDLQTSRRQDVRLELSVDGPDDAIEPQMSNLVRRLAADGVEVTFASPSERTLRRPPRAGATTRR